MRSPATRKVTYPMTEGSARQQAATRLADDFTFARRDISGSPVHEMQMRLEEAVFASFVAKEQSGRAPKRFVGAGLSILAASAGGYGLFVAGLMTHLY